MMTPSELGTWTLHRSKISYFSGKLEAYLKYKGIPFRIKEVSSTADLNTIYRHTGVKKMPAMQAENGVWVFDTTPMIAWLESVYGGTPVLPEAPALRFFALLMEDYGDEWLWRPAMWWRWVPMASRRTLGWAIGGDIVDPRFGRPLGWLFAKRQMQEWLWGDGVNEKNAHQVRDMLFREFEFLEPQLEQQPYLLGSHPSMADYGFFASMFRHFGNDPDSAEVMRMQAPNTYEWLARLWNAKPEKLALTLQWQAPEAPHWQPLLDRIANDYLPYLAQNAQAYRANKKRFDFQGKSIRFPATKTTDYRVWCFTELQRHYQALSESDRQQVEGWFEAQGGLGMLAQPREDDGLAGRYQQPLLPGEKRASLKWSILSLGQPRN